MNRRSFIRSGAGATVAAAGLSAFIRIEHHYEKLVDFRIVKSRWSKDAERGQIRNVTLRNIEVAISVFNPGYSCSLIGGFDAQHTVEHVLFDSMSDSCSLSCSIDGEHVGTRRDHSRLAWAATAH